MFSPMVYKPGHWSVSSHYGLGVCGVKTLLVMNVWMCCFFAVVTFVQYMNL